MDESRDDQNPPLFKRPKYSENIEEESNGNEFLAQMKPVLHHSELCPLEAMLSYVCKIEKKEDISRVLKYLSSTIPMTNDTAHLKRLKKEGDTSWVYICQETEFGTLPDYVKKELTEKLGLTLEIRPVSKHAPRNAAQLDSFSIYWPLNFHFPIPSTPHPQDAFEPWEFTLLANCMRIGFEYAKKLSKPCFCMIIDPKDYSIKSIQTSTIETHIFNHSAMNSIHEVAKEQKNRFPPFDNKQNSSQQVNYHNYHGMESLESDTKSYENNVSSSNSTFTSKISLPDDYQYLCTGFYAILLKEPCIMCSMALLHSRIGKVIYSLPNHNRGGLGSRMAIHCEPSLNHKFAVYSGLMASEATELINQIQISSKINHHARNNNHDVLNLDDWD